MTGSALPPPAAPRLAPVPQPSLDLLFGTWWPERALSPRPRLVLAAVLTGWLAAVVAPFRAPGLGTFLVVMTVCGVVAAADGRLRTPYHLGVGVLVTLLVATVVVRDAQWVVALCLLAAAALGVATLAEGRSVAGLLVAGLAVPLAALRGLPWLGRSVTPAAPTRRWLPALRTALVTTGLLVVFGALFASADALFASWLDALLPDVTMTTTVVRGFVLTVVTGLTLGGVYVALNPPLVERLALRPGTPVRRAFEWLVPVGVVIALFAGFVAAQLTVMFGGHAYLSRTTGLTYASYVHEGFAQLTTATALTLVVVALAVRKAGRVSSRERSVLRAMLGSLCLLTLVVVVSALFRMHVYEQAYGFTRLRLLVSVFEAWLGLVVLLVVAAGVRLSGPWVPRAALLSGAAALLALAVLNPDASIARHNLDRFADTGRVDRSYLQGLSADATPVLAGSGLASPCRHAHDDWLAWNLGRTRAERLTCPRG